MRNHIIFRLWLSFLLLSGGLQASAEEGLAPRIRQLRNRVQAMGHGYHSTSEWEKVLTDLQEVAKDAKAVGNAAQAVEAGLLQAMIEGDMHRNYVEALDILDALREGFAAEHPPNMKKVYVRQAELFAKLGDDIAIRDLIKEFRRSSYYDEQQYAYSGGQGREQPLTVVRPHGKGSGSLTVTAMERYRQAARFAPGNPCPNFQTVDRQGVSLQLADYQGQVVLIDFWMGRWAPWRRELPHLARTYREYHPYGFEIVGVALDRKGAGLNELAIREKATWRHVVGDMKLPGKFGVYGEATNFLIDQEGVIIGRDLKGSELVLAIRKALGMVDVISDE